MYNSNSLSKIAFVFISLLMIVACGNSSSSPSNTLLSDIYFPDPALAACVANTGILTVDELTVLYCGGPDITDATGIEQLEALTELHLVYNKLSTIDLSNNTSLDILLLDDNFIPCSEMDGIRNQFEDIFLTDDLNCVYEVF